jgi:hypothetical protein
MHRNPLHETVHDFQSKLYRAEQKMASLERHKKWKAGVTIGVLVASVFAAIDWPIVGIAMSAATNLIWIWET